MRAIVIKRAPPEIGKAVLKEATQTAKTEKKKGES